VLRAIETGESLQALAERSDLAISTLKKHARAIEKLLVT
jgi:DNA-binding NarL/FixJ family response regulator